MLKREFPSGSGRVESERRSNDADGKEAVGGTTGTTPGTKIVVRGSLMSRVVRCRLRIRESSMTNAERVRGVAHLGCACISNSARSYHGIASGRAY